MYDLLVRVADKPLSGNPLLDCKRTMRGDVIVVKPDGWAWSPTERNNPDWRIIKTDMTLAEAEGMTASDGGNPLANPYRRVRALKFDIDSLPQGILIAINKAPDLPITISKANLNLVKQVKLPWLDENII